MTWIAVQLIGAALATAAGILAARTSKRAATITIGAMTTLLLAKVALAYTPAAEPSLIPWNGYALIERWWFLFPGMVVFGAAITLFRDSIWKRDGLLVGAGLLLIYSATLGWVMSRPSDLMGAVDRDGFCRQTSGYSCTAAAAVMLLHRHGIAATEREMAELCVTNNGGVAGGGTTESGLMRGLRLKLAGTKEPRIVRPEFDAIPTPSIVGVRLNPWLSHSVVLLEVSPREVKVLDPLYGRGTLWRVNFERDWLGSAVWIP